MYHFVVRRRLRRAFDDINHRRWDRVLAAFAARPVHAMHGEHALGGERRAMSSIRQWYGRLQRLLPGLQFEVQAVTSSGWPWRTHASVAWRDRFVLPDGSEGSNAGVHAFVLRWGRVQEMAVHCDTARLQDYCRRMAALGLDEALAAPITDATGAAA